MSDLSGKSLGYKPHMVRELLGISKEKLRYWKTNLDPNPTRSHFSASDLFAYRIIQACIIDLRFVPSELKNFDLSYVFHFCQSHTPESLQNSVLQLNMQTNSLIIFEEGEPLDFKNRKKCYLYLNALVIEHVTAFMSLGSQELVH